MRKRPKQPPTVQFNYCMFFVRIGKEVARESDQFQTSDWLFLPVGGYRSSRASDRGV